MTMILLVDDEPNVLNSLRRVVNAMSWIAVGDTPIIEAFSSPAQALARAACKRFDIVISDYRMPEMDGVQFLDRLSRLQPGIARIILSAYADHQAMIAAINQARVSRFLLKPWNESELTLAIIESIEERRNRVENERLADEWRSKRGLISECELELRRLEAEHPGLTRIERREDGSIDLDLEFDGDHAFDSQGIRFA